MFDQWLVVLSGPEMVEQVRKLSDDVASSPDGVLYVGVRHLYPSLWGLCRFECHINTKL